MGAVLLAWAPVWSVKLGAPVKSGAAIAQGTVYIGADDGKLSALEAATGRVRWSAATGGAIEATPRVDGDAVFVGSSDGTFHAFRTNDGTPLWSHKTGDKVLGGATVADGRVFVGSYDHRLYAFDRATGKVLWSHLTDNYVHATPAVVQGRVLFGGCDGKVHILSAETGKPEGSLTLGSPIAASLAVEWPYAWVGHYGNAFVSLDLEEKTIDWRFTDRAFPFFATAALLGERVFIGGRDRFVRALDKDSGKELWRFETKGKVDAGLLVVGENVAAASADGRLYLLRARDGRKLAGYDLGAAIVGGPAQADGRIFVGATDGRVHAFGSPR